jgi:hypothetical protein
MYVFLPALLVQGFDAGIDFDAAFPCAIDKLINNRTFHREELGTGKEIVLVAGVHCFWLS